MLFNQLKNKINGCMTAPSNCIKIVSVSAEFVNVINQMQYLLASLIHHLSKKHKYKAVDIKEMLI
jgi:hypothetical protein